MIPPHPSAASASSFASTSLVIRVFVFFFCACASRGERPGYCPIDPSDGVCDVNLCQNDDFCPKEKKCCPGQCGFMVCMKPLLAPKRPGFCPPFFHVESAEDPCLEVIRPVAAPLAQDLDAVEPCVVDNNCTHAHQKCCDTWCHGFRRCKDALKEDSSDPFSPEVPLAAADDDDDDDDDESEIDSPKNEVSPELNAETERYSSVDGNYKNDNDVDDEEKDASTGKDDGNASNGKASNGTSGKSFSLPLENKNHSTNLSPNFFCFNLFSGFFLFLLRNLN